MTVGELKKVVAAYLQVPTSDLVQNNIDLGIVALNNARRRAELHKDWQTELYRVKTTTTLGDGNWESMTRVSDSASVTVKTPQTFWMLENEVLVPLYHHTIEHGATWARERLASRSFTTDRRYLRDDEYRLTLHEMNPGYSSDYQIFLRGTEFIIEPTPSENKEIHVDGFIWLDDYTDDADTDFFTERGEEYMQWSAVVDLNHIFQAFIPQTEGNLSPPVRARNEALEALAKYDEYNVHVGRHPM